MPTIVVFVKSPQRTNTRVIPPIYLVPLRRQLDPSQAEPVISSGAHYACVHFVDHMQKPSLDVVRRGTEFERVSFWILESDPAKAGNQSTPSV